MPQFTVTIYELYSDGSTIGPMRNGLATLSVSCTNPPAGTVPPATLCSRAPTDANGQVAVNIPNAWRGQFSLLYDIVGPPAAPGGSFFGIYQNPGVGGGPPYLQPIGFSCRSNIPPPLPTPTPTGE